jgi:DnaJ like chaperone protein
MAWWGKVVGGAFGFMLGGPLGALFGAAVGHHFDHGLDASASADTGASLNERIQLAFFTATFSVMGHLAKADGRVTRDEIDHARAVMREMRLSPDQIQVAESLFRSGREASFNLDAVLGQLVRECRRRTTLLQMFIEIQLHAAYADGELHPRELDVLRHCAARLGFAPAQLEQLVALVEAARGAHGRQRTSRPEVMSLDSARAILGVKPDAGQADIKRAYRRLMSQHHPDKLASKGLPEEMLKVATEKTQEIRAAYERLRDAGHSS